MYVDSRLEMCNATALNTGAAGTYLLADQIDLKRLNMNPGHGEEVYLVVRMVTAATSGGAATLTILLASDDTASIATNGTATEHLRSRTFALAALTAGATILAVPLPAHVDYERFLGILQITGTAAFTGGTIDAFLTHDVNLWRAYADATN